MEIALNVTDVAPTFVNVTDLAALVVLTTTEPKLSEVPPSWRPGSLLSSTAVQEVRPPSMRSLTLCGGRNESWKKLIGAAVGTDFQSNERRRGLEFGERSRRGCSRLGC